MNNFLLYWPIWPCLIGLFLYFQDKWGLGLIKITKRRRIFMYIALAFGVAGVFDMLSVWLPLWSSYI